jgi:broad specificity phosphatase PhoE
MSGVIPPGLDATLAFERHGESVYIAEGRFQGQADTPLSELGERQARLAARRLASPGGPPVLPVPSRPPLEIVHSPLARTALTARLAAEAIGAAAGETPLQALGRLRPDAAFLEIGQGAWEGLTRAEIERDHADTLAAWRRSPIEANAPGGERLVDVRGRVIPGLAALLARLAAEPDGPRSDTTAGGYPPAVSPGAPWSVVVAHDGVFKVALLTLLDLPLERFWAFPFAMCGLSVIEIRDGIAVLRAHNLTEHLAPLLDEVAVGETEERQRSGAL